MDKQTLITDFFEQLVGEEVEINFEETDDEIKVDVQVDPEYSGIMIGYRGEVLSAIQLVLSLMIQPSFEDWYPVRLNINNYKEQRIEALESLAENTAQRVVRTGQALSLPNLSSYERRLIHSKVSEIEGVGSFSQGDGRDRVLIIAPSEQISNQ